MSFCVNASSLVQTPPGQGLIMVFLRAAAVLALFLLIHEASMLTFAFSLSSNSNRDALHKCDNTQGLGNNVGAADVMANSSRRSFFHSTAAAVFVPMIISVEPSNAAADCFNDCFKVRHDIVRGKFAFYANESFIFLFF